MLIRSLLLGAVLVAARTAAQQLFVDAEYPLGFSGRAMAGADLDGDGDRDLVVCSVDDATSSSTCHVWLNDGSAGFSPATEYQTLAGLQSASLVDLNGDGEVDLLLSSPGIPSQSPGGVSVLLGDGAGGFGAGFSQFVAGAPRLPAIADVDGDGLLDAALPAPGISSVALLLGKGTGAFSAPTLVVAGAKPVAVSLVDLQLDGYLDLVALNGLAVGATVTRRLGGAGASFGPAATSALPAGTLESTLLSAGPIDGDAFPDVVVCEGPQPPLPALPGAVALLRGDGAGGFLPGVVSDGPLYPTGLRLADLDLDGDLETLATGVIGPYMSPELTPGVWVYSEDDTGTLIVTPGAMPGTGVSCADSGDLDGDLLPDVAAVRVDQRLAVRLGDGLGALRDVPVVQGGGVPIGAALADFDGDDRPDLLVGEEPFGTIGFLRNDGQGRLLDPILIDLGPQALPGDTAAADIDGDGHQDAVVSDRGHAAVAVLSGDGAGGFGPAVMTQCGQDARFLIASDLDGDADPDVVTCNTEDWTVAVLLDSGGALLPGVPTAVGKRPIAMALGDIDGDAAPDVITASQSFAQYTLLRGDGGGGWLPAVTLPGTLAFRQCLALGDLNGDGHDDFAAALNVTDPQGTLDIWLADGAGGLLPPTHVQTPHNASGLELADLDVDGVLDAVMGHDWLTSGAAPQVTFLRGIGAGEFAPPEAHLVDSSSTAVASADMNGDGLPDVVTTDAGFNAVRVLLNTLDLSSPWTQLGFGLAGDSSPALAGAGSLEPASPGHLTLFGAPPAAPAALFLGAASMPTAFKGGTLVPNPPLVTLLLVMPFDGLLHLAWSEWPALPTGATFHLQAAVVDPGAPAGVALTGALQGVVP